MSDLMKSMVPLLCVTALLSACGTTGWGQKSEGSTHTLTGGAEAAPTSEATPQPARPRGDTQRTMPGGAQGGVPSGTSESQGGMPSGPIESQGGVQPGSTHGGSIRGDTTTGGAEAAPTTEGTPSGPAGAGGAGAATGAGGAGEIYSDPGGLQMPPRQ